MPIDEVTRASGTCSKVNAYDQIVIAPAPVVPASEMRYAKSSCTTTTDPTRGKRDRRASRNSGSRKFGRAGRRLLRINTTLAMARTAIAPAAVPSAGPYPPAARPPMSAPAIVPVLYTRPVIAVTPNFDRAAAALVQTAESASAIVATSKMTLKSAASRCWAAGSPPTRRPLSAPAPTTTTNEKAPSRSNMAASTDPTSRCARRSSPRSSSVLSCGTRTVAMEPAATSANTISGIRNAARNGSRVPVAPKMATRTVIRAQPATRDARAPEARMKLLCAVLERGTGAEAGCVII